MSSFFHPDPTYYFFVDDRGLARIPESDIPFYLMDCWGIAASSPERGFNAQMKLENPGENAAQIDERCRRYNDDIWAASGLLAPYKFRGIERSMGEFTFPFTYAYSLVCLDHPDRLDMEDMRQVLSNLMDSHRIVSPYPYAREHIQIDMRM